MIVSYLSPKAEARRSELDGRGAFSIAPIAAGEMVALFGGHVYDLATYEKLSPQLQAITISIWPGFQMGPVEDSEIGDADFVNHSCAPNCGIKGQLMVVALTDIPAGVELTFDYGTVLVEHGDGVFRMDCRCGTPSCRGQITSDDWRIPELRRRYAGYLSVAVQALVDADERAQP